VDALFEEETDKGIVVPAVTKELPLANARLEYSFRGRSPSGDALSLIMRKTGKPFL
jgi:hypothetical protein